MRSKCTRFDEIQIGPVAGLVGVLIFTAFPASADAGTPYLLTSLFLLLFGNIAIAAVETILLWLLLNRPALNRTWIHAFLILVLANYASMSLGMLSPPFSERILGPIPLYGVRAHTAWSMVWSYALTLVVEFPFVYWATSITTARRPTASKAIELNLLLQTVTCSFVFYLTLHTMWLPASKQIDPTLPSRQQASGWVYFLAPGGHSLDRIHLNGTGHEIVRNLPGTAHSDVLILEPTAAPQVFEIHGRRWENGTMQEAFTGPELTLPFEEYSVDLLWLRKIDLRPPSEQIVDFMHVASAGLIVTDKSRRVEVLVDVPHCFWYGYGSGTAIALPGQRFVFQLGPQIALYSLAENKLGVLALGSCPIYVPDSI